MPSSFTCGHTCSGCTHKTPRKNDMDRHEQTTRTHQLCNEGCPRYVCLNRPTIRVLTPETMSAGLGAQPNTRSASRSQSNTPSASSTSSRKRARERSPEEDAEEGLKRKKRERRVLIEALKICCVLDPSRAAQNYEEIEGHSCWVDAELPGEQEEVDQLIRSGELSGFVFRVPKYANQVRLYDWVSRVASQINVRLVYMEERRRILRTPASERRGILSYSRPGRSFPNSSLMRPPIRRFGNSEKRGSIVFLGGLISQFGTPVFLGYAMVLTRPHRPPFTVVGSIENKELNGLVELAGAFPVFPSPQGCMSHGAKVAFNRRLDTIAETMKMRRPKTKAVADTTTPPHGMVLKREFSDASRDVFIPDPKLSEEAGIEHAVKFITERTRANPEDRSLWLAQEFVPFLSIGEVRFMCVGGSPIREVLTGKFPADDPDNPGGLWSFEGCDNLKTISELQ
jgi:hypothetical protein